jgi:hypothetical protein
MLDRQRSDGCALKIAVAAFLTVTASVAVAQTRNLFYCIAVAPQDEYQAYQRSFQRVAQSIRLSD